MAANQPDPKRLAEVAKAWGFTDTKIYGNHRGMSYHGTEVRIRRDVKEARPEDIAAMATLVDLGPAEFIAGPTKKPPSANKSRRRVVEFLARLPNMRVVSEDGRCVGQVATRLGMTNQGLNALLSTMARDGQITLQRRGTAGTYRIELCPKGPRVDEMLPLDLVRPVNAHLAPVEPERVDAPEPAPNVQMVDLSGYHPDDIAAALMNRVIATISEGSQAVHAKEIHALELRLADQTEAADAERRKRSRLEDQVDTLKADLARVKAELTAAQRIRREVPRETIDILVNGVPRHPMNGNTRPVSVS
jgi:hypothetical protein